MPYVSGRRTLNRAALNWARLALSHDHGKVQIHNLWYDFRKRPVARTIIEQFFRYLDSTNRYKDRIPPSARKRHWTSLASLGEIRDYCKASKVTPPVRQQAPQISASSLNREAPDNKIARVVEEDKVVGNYMLYAQTSFRVQKPRRQRVREAVRWTLSKTLMKDSYKSRRELERLARQASVDPKQVRFFTISCRYPGVPRNCPMNEAMWACSKLGLIFKWDTQLALVTFVLHDQSGHWRPTTFSGDGHAAFCARDHRDGFGRTMPLKGTRVGLRELVVAEGGPLELLDCKPLGTTGVNTVALVDSGRIVTDLLKRMSM